MVDVPLNQTKPNRALNWKMQGLWFVTWGNNMKLEVARYLCSSYHTFSPKIRIQVVQPCNSTDMVTAWKNSHFILSEISNFHKINSLSIAVHDLLMNILTSLSVDEILLPRYMNWSSDFGGLSFNERRKNKSRR